MGLKNLRDKVKQHQEKVGEKVFCIYHPVYLPPSYDFNRELVLCWLAFWNTPVRLQWNTVAKLQEEWVENADRWVAGFLEKFEEGCHSMVSYPLTTLWPLNAFDRSPLVIYVLLFPKLPQGTAIKERIQERLIKAQSGDFGSLLQYDSYDSDEANEDDEDELFEDVKE